MVTEGKTGTINYKIWQNKFIQDTAENKIIFSLVVLIYFVL